MGCNFRMLEAYLGALRKFSQEVGLKRESIITKIQAGYQILN
jgi:hypothetical protein